MPAWESASCPARSPDVAEGEARACSPSVGEVVVIEGYRYERCTVCTVQATHKGSMPLMRARCVPRRARRVPRPSARPALFILRASTATRWFTLRGGRVWRRNSRPGRCRAPIPARVWEVVRSVRELRGVTVK